jgi:hypothetical protein
VAIIDGELHYLVEIKEAARVAVSSGMVVLMWAPWAPVKTYIYCVGIGGRRIRTCFRK